MIAFARTIRALDADDFRGSMLGFLFAIVLIGLWTWWMLTPSVPQYSVLAESASLDWNPDSHTVAVSDLPVDYMHRVHAGQAVRIDIEGRIIDAQVVGVSNPVMLDVPSKTQPPLPSRAKVEIEVERISPATIALRAIR